MAFSKLRLPSLRTATWALLGFAAIALLARFWSAGYPREWPSAKPSASSMSTGCPDLTGHFDHVGSEFLWLLSTSADFLGPARKSMFEHKASITMLENGRVMRIAITLNERGLVDYRNHSIRYDAGNVGTDEMTGSGHLTLRLGQHYHCSGGWLFNSFFAQPQRKNGWKPESLKFSRDKEGGLIAGATINMSNSVKWGDAPAIGFGNSDRTRWFRWPARPAASDATLPEVETVSLSRAWWINGKPPNQRVPVKVWSFLSYPVCARLVETPRAGGAESLHTTPGRYVGPHRVDDCPKGWGGIWPGGAFIAPLGLAEEGAPIYHVQWWAMPGDGGRAEEDRSPQNRPRPSTGEPARAQWSTLAIGDVMQLEPFKQDKPTDRNKDKPAQLSRTVFIANT